MMSVDITVAVCTYNRAVLLGGALGSICRQTLSADRFEILVIDNGSTDHTADCVHDFSELYPNHTICRVYEAGQGLSRARNVALQWAQGCYVAFLDDDARAPADWLVQALDKIRSESYRPFLCLGGPIQPFYTSAKPVWFRDVYESRSWGDEERLLQNGESFSGSNMIWNRADLVALGGFDERVGVRGRTLSLGEETNVFKKAWQQFENPILRYDPTLVVRHWVPAFKMKVSYRLKRAFVAGQIAIVQGSNKHGRGNAMLGAIKGILLGSFKALWRYGQYDHWQNWAIDEGRPIMINLGTILAAIGIFITVRQE